MFYGILYECERDVVVVIHPAAILPLSRSLPVPYRTIPVPDMQPYQRRGQHTGKQGSLAGTPGDDRT